MMMIFKQWLLIVAMLVAIVVLLKLLDKRLVKLLDADRYPQMLQWIRLILYSACMLAILALILNVLNVSSESVRFFIGSVMALLGVALFAEWSLLSNLSAGLMLMFTAPVSVGDNIKVLDKDIPLQGRIRSIGLIYTRLISVTGDDYLLPNRMLLQSRLQKISGKPVIEVSLKSVESVVKTLHS
ncbi:mechanosensitive ion channel domain-containing protein [Pelagibaculum spongiae]|uniref:Small-conductance mechanosensitive channel n=1 Tax=Pelagibaculum spongiae TaxID=2080658 RepID=A0A2V1GWR7_9GAMM|nr:mechanosensitive ion channel domain-containing protein [Pelagibaculum spongiae]PVZ65636.1 hypothetical protein DC094_17265 [Pelagibaculum spongiae]